MALSILKSNFFILQSSGGSIIYIWSSLETICFKFESI